MVINYQLGKIYKIYSPSNPELVYYGSSCQKLCQRLEKHQINFRQYKKNKYCKMSSFQIFENCNDYIIELVEYFPCNNKQELRIRERYYIQNYNLILFVPLI